MRGKPALWLSMLSILCHFHGLPLGTLAASSLRRAYRERFRSLHRNLVRYSRERTGRILVHGVTQLVTPRSTAMKIMLVSVIGLLTALGVVAQTPSDRPNPPEIASV